MAKADLHHAIQHLPCDLWWAKGDVLALAHTLFEIDEYDMALRALVSYFGVTCEVLDKVDRFDKMNPRLDNKEDCHALHCEVLRRYLVHDDFNHAWQFLLFTKKEWGVK